MGWPVIESKVLKPTRFQLRHFLGSVHYVSPYQLQWYYHHLQEYFYIHIIYTQYILEISKPLAVYF